MQRVALPLLALLVVLSAPAAAHAAFPGANGRVLFSSGNDVFTDDGTNLTATLDEKAAQASWSPDGRRIALRVGTEGTGTPLRIGVMNADGTGLRVFGGESRHETQPGWSPDGARLVYRRAVPGDAASGDVWSMTADGADRRAVVAAPGSDERYPVLSPTGAALAFTSTREGGVEIFVAAPDGSAVRRVSGDALRDSAPSWSPDGARIAFERGSAENAADNEIWTMAAAGGDERRLTANSVLEEGPAWSPDGTQLAFTSTRGDGLGIWRMATDGSSPAVVADGAGTQESPDWQPLPRGATAPFPLPGSAATPGPPAPLPPAPGATAPVAGPDPDRDRDGLVRSREQRLRTSDLDRDSDDDGLSDGREALRRAGSPRRFDTDRDGLSDGVERGVTRPVADPPGPVRGTARRRFERDADARTRTDPWRRDTDRDGVRDGREDRDRDGRRDRGERDPRRAG